MTREELEARAAEIDAMSRDGLDVEALEQLVNERESINTQLAELRAAAAADEEKRAQLAETAKPIEAPEERKSTDMYGIETKEYRDIFMMNLQGKTLSEEQRATLNTATNSVGYAIPTVTANEIIENLTQIAPLLGEIDLMQIPGNVSIAVEGTRNAAGIHVEGADITPAGDTITRVTLTGYEMVKVLSISAAVKNMSIEAFEKWLVSNLSRSLAELLENYIVNGTGSSQPKGIDCGETWTDGTNAVDFAAAAPTIAEISTMIGLMNPAYVGGAKFLMNWADFWKVHDLRDDKNPTLVEKQGDTWYIFGFPVVLSSKVASGDFFFGNLREAVKANMAQPVTIERNASSGFRSNTIDYRGACEFDCTVIPGRIIKGANTL